MASPQTGIFALGTGSHAYLEFDLAANSQPTEAVARVASLREPRTTIGGVNLVAGFRPELWAAVAPDAGPPDVVGFNEPLVGGGYVLPATQHDVVMRLAGSGYDAVFDLSCGIVSELSGVATLADEIVGWPYHHDRDLTGFIDGTENPSLVEAMGVALIPLRLPGRRRFDPPPAAVGARCGRLGATAGRYPGSDHRSAKGRQRRGRSSASSVTRGTDGPGAIRKDLPAEHRVRDPHAPWNDLCRIQRRPANPAGDAGEHARRRRWPPRQAARRDPPADRRLLRHPIGRSTRCLRSRERMLDRVIPLGTRCVDHGTSFGGATDCREEAVRVRGLGRAIASIEAGCTDEAAEVSEHRVAPIVGVGHVE